MKIGFIGTGNMGGALAQAAAKSVPDAKIFLTDFDKNKAKALAGVIGGQVADSIALCRECDLVFLGVKPQGLSQLLVEIAPVVKERGESLTLVSMAAGIPISTVEKELGEGTPIIRIMPNTPVSVGKGLIAYCQKNVSPAAESAFLASLKNAGRLEKLDEGKMDAAAALHGCGPAYVYLFMEALADGAVACGLPRDMALRFAAQTVAGAAEMVLETGRQPGELKDAVCSPGGTTIQGVRALEKAGFRSAAMEAVIAAYKKTVEMGK